MMPLLLASWLLATSSDATPSPPAGGPDAVSPGPTPILAGTPEPAPAAGPAPEFRRLRARDEHRRLRFLLGDWAAEASWADGSGRVVARSRGRLTVRWDLGGLLLIERWQLDGEPDDLEVRRIWYWDDEAKAFRVVMFTSLDTTEAPYTATIGDSSITIERQITSPEPALERIRYAVAATGEDDEPLRLTIREERGPAADQLRSRLEVTLTRDGR